MSEPKFRSDLVFVAFEPVPNAKGSGTRISQMMRALGSMTTKLSCLSLPGTLQERPSASAEYVELPIREPNLLTRALAFRTQVARALLARRPRVVHFRGIFEGEAAIGYAEKFGAKTVFEVNGLPSIELVYHYPALKTKPGLVQKLQEMETRLLKRASAVITQSQTTLRFLQGRGLPASTPVSVIPNGATPQAYPAQSSLPQQAVVFYAGTLAPWQGVLELLSTAAICRTRMPISLVLAGPVRKRWRAEILGCIEHHQLQDCVELTGQLSRDEVAQRLSQASLCVAPLRMDERNLVQGCSPIKIFEYMAAGKSTLATDMACTREILSKERGVLIPNNEPALWADKMLSLLQDPDAVLKRGQAARSWVQAHATWKHRHEAIVAFYRDHKLLQA